MKPGHLLDAYLLFQTHSGIALTLSKEDSLKHESEIRATTQSIEKLIETERSDLIEAIKDANTMIDDVIPVGSTLSVQTIEEGIHGIRVRTLEEPKFEAYLPNTLVTHLKGHAEALHSKLTNKKRSFDVVMLESSTLPIAAFRNELKQASQLIANSEDNHGFGWVSSIQGKRITLSTFNSTIVCRCRKEELTVGDLLAYRLKPKTEIFYGNENDFVKELTLKATLDDLCFLSLRASKKVKTASVGAVVTLNVEIVKDYGSLGHLAEFSELSGFVNDTNRLETMKRGEDVKCVIIDINIEKRIAQLLPIQNTSENVTKDSLIDAKSPSTWRKVLSKSGYSVLVHSENDTLVAISHSDVEDTVEGLVVDENESAMFPYLTISDKKERAEKSQSIHPGNTITATVRKIRSNIAFFKFEQPGTVGSLHITDWGADVESFKALKKGTELSLFIKSVSKERKLRIVDLAFSKENANEALVRGKPIKAIVKRYNKFASNPLLIETSRSTVGSIFFSDIDTSKSYALGDVITVYFKTKSHEAAHDMHYFTMKKSQKVRTPKVGEVVDCRFVKFRSGFGATVQINKDTFGFIDLAEISDELEPKIDLVLKKRGLFPARIIAQQKTGFSLSARDSIVDEESWNILSADGSSADFKDTFAEAEKNGDIRALIQKFQNWKEHITENMLVRGYVTSQNKHGVFIKLAKNLTVRASYRELADLNSAQKKFAQNTLVIARITGFFKDKVNVSLRESAVQYGINRITLDDLQEGSTIKCQVISQAQGVAFVQVIGSQFRAKLTTDNLKLVPGSLALGKLIKVDSNDPPRINLEQAQPLDEQLSTEQQHLKSLMESIREI